MDKEAIEKDDEVTEDFSIKSLQDSLSSIRISHFVDIKLVGFRRNGNGNVFLSDTLLQEYMELLGR